MTDERVRRVSLVCGVAYGEDVARTREVIQNAVQSCDLVSADHPVHVFASAFGSSSIDFTVLWWTRPKPIEQLRAKDQVVESVKSSLDREGIEIPFPYRTLTFKESLNLDLSGESISRVRAAGE